MEIKNLKEYLYNNPDKIQLILEECGFHHIKKHSGTIDDYLTLANPDGDNPNSITIYLSTGLLTINYTRDICSSKNNCDFLDLVCWARPGFTFFENIKWISEISGLDYYKDFEKDMPESLKILRLLKELLNKQKDSADEDNTPLTPKDKAILSYYLPYLSTMFYEDGISWETQLEFGIKYDQFSNRIVIPIFDEINSLIAVKGRYFERTVPETEIKYLYLEKGARGKVLYGYNKSGKYIQESDCVYVTEAEKGTLQFWSYGIKNVVSIGASKLTKVQIDKLSRLNKTIILSFDKDIDEEKIQHIRDMFLSQIPFFAVIDKENILSEKESPSDNAEKLKYLLKNHVYEIKRSEENEV